MLYDMQEINHSDNELLQSIADGNEISFAHFFRAVAPFLYADITTALGAHGEDATTVMQETFIVIWLHRDKLPQVKDLNGYLRSVAMRECFTYLEGDEGEELLPIPPYEEEEESSPGNEHFKTYQSLIHDTIMHLPPQQRLIYEMHRLQGMSPAQIAGSLHFSVENVNNAIHAVEQSIRQCLVDIGHSSVTALHNNWVVEKTKELETNPPVIGQFDENWTHIQSKVTAVDRPIPADSTPVIRQVYSHRLNYWYAAAALVFLIFGPGIYLLVMKSEKSAAFKDGTIVHDRGSRDTLPDGTKVWLNTGSTLKYRETLNPAVRIIGLKGEACFKTVREVQLPFYMNAYGLKTDITGSYFNVHAYSAPLHMTVTAMDSIVSVKHGNTLVTLQPGHQVEIRQTGKMTVTPGDSAAIINWIRKAQ
jgi:RNA polymerase sigma factor (sigma-70 family)